MRYPIMVEGKGEVGHFELTAMPGCPKVAISHGLNIAVSCRGLGYGRAAMEDRIRQARELGFQLLMCTVVVGNSAQEKIMARYQFRPVSTFDNATTGNKVVLYYKNITDPYDCGFFAPGGCR
jgi:RimJ/RimL family protein N-acetyltransferase